MQSRALGEWPQIVKQELMRLLRRGLHPLDLSILFPLQWNGRSASPGLDSAWFFHEAMLAIPNIATCPLAWFTPGLYLVANMLYV